MTVCTIVELRTNDGPSVLMNRRLATLKMGVPPELLSALMLNEAHCRIKLGEDQARGDIGPSRALCVLLLL
eukprot:3382959-Pleurochrysis_carterae.AAC.1